MVPGTQYPATITRVTDAQTYNVIYTDGESRSGLLQENIWLRDPSATTHDLNLLPVAARLGKICSTLVSRYADVVRQGDVSPAYTAQIDEDSLAHDAIGTVVERLQMLNSELPIDSQLPIRSFWENSVQGTRQCMEMLRQMASLCSDTLTEPLEFQDPANSRDGPWLPWETWWDAQRDMLESEIMESPTAKFVETCCAICFSVTSPEELKPHPIFENRKVCTRAKCAMAVAQGFQQSGAGGYSECMVCMSEGRLVECVNCDDDTVVDHQGQDGCPWSVCIGCLFYQDEGQRGIWTDQILDDQEAEWKCFVCKRNSEGGHGSASAAAAALSADIVRALRVRHDWNVDSVTIRGLEADIDDDDNDPDDDDDDDEYQSNGGRKKKAAAPRRRRRSTPKKSVAKSVATRKRVSTLDLQRTHTRPIPLFEISFRKGDEAETFARDAALETWSVNANLVSAAPRLRYFFGLKRPSIPLQQSKTIPLTIVDFLKRHEGPDNFAARKWHTDDKREHFSTVTTKGMGDILKRIHDKSIETDADDWNLKSPICTADDTCWICKKREGIAQELNELTEKHSTNQGQIKELEKGLREHCGNRKHGHTWLKKIKEGNFIWTADGMVEPLPMHYNELLMGFPANYCSASSSLERQKQCGNAVVPPVIDYNLREQVTTLPKDRRWVVLSLFNGVDGFPLGVMEAAESLWIIDELLKKQEVADTAAAAAASAAIGAAAAAAAAAAGNDDHDDSSSDDSYGAGRNVLMKKQRTFHRTDLLGKCCADLRALAKDRSIPLLPDSNKSPPWLRHGMLIVTVECCENARRVTSAQHKARRDRYRDDKNKWTLVDKAPEFLAKENVMGRPDKDGKEAVYISKGEPDVATVSKLTVLEIEAAIRSAAYGDDAKDQKVEIDIICGGSPCVNMVGNAAFSKTTRSFETLKDDDPSMLWHAQKHICHNLMKEYKRRDESPSAGDGGANGMDEPQEDLPSQHSSQQSSGSSQGSSDQQQETDDSESDQDDDPADAPALPSAAGAAGGAADPVDLVDDDDDADGMRTDAPPHASAAGGPGTAGGGVKRPRDGGEQSSQLETQAHQPPQEEEPQSPDQAAAAAAAPDLSSSDGDSSDDSSDDSSLGWQKVVFSSKRKNADGQWE